MTVPKTQELEKILFIPDSHHPFVDKRAWNLMLKAAREFKPDHVVILGDFVDCFSISSHPKDPSIRYSLEEELEYGRKALTQLESLGAKHLYYISGNHENRLERFLASQAPALNGSISIPTALGLKQRGWKWIPYKQHLKIGKLFITHDVGKAGPYSVFDAQRAFESNVVIGHVHNTTYTVKGSARGEIHVGASFGWLGDRKSADYMYQIKAARDWSLAFGVGFLNPKNGYIYLNPVPIVNYTVVLSGKLYNG